MLIGFLLSALAIRCMFKSHTAYAFFAPIALLAIPFIDTGAAIIRRRLTGRSIFEVDRGHLHHALMKRGYTPRVSLLWVALLCSTTAAGAVLSLLEQRSEYALVSILIVVVVMVGCKIFGVAEYQLVSRKASSLARSFFKISANNNTQVLQSSVHVQGNRNWQEMWKSLCDFADEHELNQLTLDLNMPWLHESFHATRRRADADRGENKEWFTMIPLIVDGRCFGRLELNGAFGQKFDHHQIIQNLLKVTNDIEQSLEQPEEVEAHVPLQEFDSQQPAGTSF
jgi:UDP-GlcNAc:undecaprenyl-phosphate GlcNAc-1-phosphate transferase